MTDWVSACEWVHWERQVCQVGCAVCVRCARWVLRCARWLCGVPGGLCGVPGGLCGVPGGFCGVPGGLCGVPGSHALTQSHTHTDTHSPRHPPLQRFTSLRSVFFWGEISMEHVPELRQVGCAVCQVGFAVCQVGFAVCQVWRCAPRRLPPGDAERATISGKFMEYQDTREKLKAKHGRALQRLFSQLQSHTAWPAEAMSKLPIVEELVEALQTAHGDHALATTPAALREGTESRPQHPNYGQLFQHAGLICLPEGHKGRKPPAGVYETPWEPASLAGSSHGDWWMQKGGFEDERLGGNSERAQAGYHSRWLAMARRQS